MTFNGEQVNDSLIKNRLALSLADISPEQEAEFAKREQERLHKEGIDRVANSNKFCEIPRRFWDANFSKYPSELNTKVRELCLEENSDKFHIISGTVGRGKTTMLCSAIHARAYQGKTDSMYFSIRFLEMKLRNCRTFNTDENEERFINRLAKYSFLCIDEVGTCPNQKEESDFLGEIISARYDNMLPTWIATNLSPVAFKALICNQDISNYSRDELEKWSKQVDIENPILNRIKSVAVINVLNGESFRGVYNGDNSAVF